MAFSDQLINPQNDPMGAAILDYARTGKSARLRVLSSMFDEDEMPIETLFRSFREMPVIEQEALRMAKGKILDVGAGSGCHALALQEMGKDVCAVEISPLSVEAMQLRGVKDARLVNMFDQRFTDKYDTILMLMNGSGIVGRLENMPMFFARMREMLNPGGVILMDSSDLKYLYENEDGSFDVDLNGEYYGLVDYEMQYKDIKGGKFDCLYVDFDTLSCCAEACGFEATLIKEGPHYDYLCMLTIKE